MKDLVSIIIPIYNTEEYLIRCIESVIRQTYENIEILLINDGSTDGSLSICDAYAGRDNRIKVLSQTNKGLSAARNLGIENAKGEYISFVDSDDYIHDEYINYLLTLLKRNSADISICSKVKFVGSVYNQKDEWKNREYVVTGEEALRRFCYHKIPVQACGKLYRTHLFDEIRFPVGRIYEDYGIMYKLFYESTNVVVGSAPYYYHFQRPGSITNSNFTKRNMDRAVLTEEFVNFIKADVPQLAQASYTRALVTYLILNRDCPRTEEFKAENMLICKGLKAYADKVIKDDRADIDKRIMGIIVKLSPRLMRCIMKVQERVSKK